MCCLPALLHLRPLPGRMQGLPLLHQAATGQSAALPTCSWTAMQQQEKEEVEVQLGNRGVWLHSRLPSVPRAVPLLQVHPPKGVPMVLLLLMQQQQLGLPQVAPWPTPPRVAPARFPPQPGMRATLVRRWWGRWRLGASGTAAALRPWWTPWSMTQRMKRRMRSCGRWGSWGWGVGARAGQGASIFCKELWQVRQEQGDKANLSLPELLVRSSSWTGQMSTHMSQAVCPPRSCAAGVLHTDDVLTRYMSLCPPCCTSSHLPPHSSRNTSGWLPRAWQGRPRNVPGGCSGTPSTATPLSLPPAPRP